MFRLFVVGMKSITKEGQKDEHGDSIQHQAGNSKGTKLPLRFIDGIASILRNACQIAKLVSEFDLEFREVSDFGEGVAVGGARGILVEIGRVVHVGHCVGERRYKERVKGCKAGRRLFIFLLGVTNTWMNHNQCYDITVLG